MAMMENFDLVFNANDEKVTQSTTTTMIKTTTTTIERIDMNKMISLTNFTPDIFAMVATRIATGTAVVIVAGSNFATNVCNMMLLKYLKSFVIQKYQENINFNENHDNNGYENENGNVHENANNNGKANGKGGKSEKGFENENKNDIGNGNGDGNLSSNYPMLEFSKVNSSYNNNNNYNKNINININNNNNNNVMMKQMKEMKEKKMLAKDSNLAKHFARDNSLKFKETSKMKTIPWMIFGLILILSGKLEYANASMGKPEPMFISRSETFKFVSGDTIVLPCEVANTDPYVVAWKRGIAILTAGSVKVTPDPRVRLVNGFNLQIRDAVPQDAGDYICQIAMMVPREITHTVEILVPPRIHHISTGGHLQVKKGSSVRIECSASGNPTPNVTWSRKNNILPNGEEKLHSTILSIENVDRHKGGIYICTANNGVGQPASSQVALHVLYPPEIAVERSIVFTGEGREAVLVCIVHGETQPEVIWFKDTMQLDTTERHIMENRGSRHTLIIRKVHPQDFGNYSCVAENQLGKSRKTLQLSGKPNVAVFNSAPISQYKDRYNISWSVDSHSPIEEYKLSFRRLPQGHEVDNSIDSQSSSSSMIHTYGSGTSSNMGYGSGIYGNHRVSGVGINSYGGYGGYGHIGIQWGRNDWRDVVLPAIPLSHHFTQTMSYMIRGLDPDQHYEATVQSRNQFGWSEITHSFVFSTSSNDSEMRDLSVTFYGGVSGMKPMIGVLLALGLGTLAFNLMKMF